MEQLIRVCEMIQKVQIAVRKQNTIGFMEMTPAAYQQAAAALYNVWMNARSSWATQPYYPSAAKKKKKKNRRKVGSSAALEQVNTI